MTSRPRHHFSSESDLEDLNDAYHGSDKTQPRKNVVINAKHVNFVQSKCVSPFLLRKSVQLETSNDSSKTTRTEQSFIIEDKISNVSSYASTIRMKNNNCNNSDSGLSSLNSAQLFFAEIREFFITDSKNSASLASSLNNLNYYSKKSGYIKNEMEQGGNSLVNFANKININLGR